MRLTIYLTAAVLVVCAGTAAAHPKSSFEIKKTTWTFVDDGKKMRESIDAEGNYIANTVAGKHVDHGTAVMRGGKACFTSAMTKEGEGCWTTRPVKIGQSMVTTNNKGKKLKVTRVKYVKLEMPK